MARCVMTVDDSVSIRQMIHSTLTQLGYEVIEAKDGQDAIEKLGHASVDLIITDLNMPRVNGIELIQWVRGNADLRFVPILMLTTETGAKMKEAGRDAGATGWIAKPFDAESLAKVIKKVID